MQKNITRRTYSNDITLPDDIHPVLKRIYSSRNIRSEDEIDYSLKRLLPFDQLMGITEAVKLLEHCLQDNKRILIVADFDADGATSCALAKRGLELMGAVNVNYIVPNRFEFGYGLSPEIVEVAAQHRPDVIITVDNGISSIDGVSLARSKNIDVLITDHHLPGNHVPDATVIVNPNQVGDQFPSKNLAGVGVIFYLLMALRKHLREKGWFNQKNIDEPNLAELLDLVALGTVADVVPLDQNNRILVSQGIARIRAGKCCEGIKALFQVAKRPRHNVSSADLGFVVAPRLNAAGRLTDMTLGIECLLSDDQQSARQLARRLDQLNQERREIQAEMQLQALNEVVGIEPNTIDRMNAGFCLFNESWHQGVIGVLASKIKDKLHRPVIAFARDNNGFLKGSARSIQGIHIRDVLETIAGKHPGLIDKFGGHAMAAGLTLRESDLSRFESVFDQVTGQFMTDDSLERSMLTDGELSGDDLNFSLAEILVNAGPWGQGFPEPRFDGEFCILDRKTVGSNHLKLNLKLVNHDQSFEAIAFNMTDKEWPASTERVKTVYKLDINEFAGRRKLQLVLDYIIPLQN